MSTSTKYVIGIILALIIVFGAIGGGIVMLLGMGSSTPGDGGEKLHNPGIQIDHSVTVTVGNVSSAVAELSIQSVQVRESRVVLTIENTGTKRVQLDRYRIRAVTKTATGEILTTEFYRGSKTIPAGATTTVRIGFGGSNNQKERVSVRVSCNPLQPGQYCETVR